MRPRTASIRSGAALALLLPGLTGAIAQPLLLLGDTPTEALAQWERRSFEGETRYTAERRDGVQALCSLSRDSASALLREVEIDLRRTPILNWRWRVDEVRPRRDDRQFETTKAGDDFAARLYIIVRTGWLPLSVQALNYVWADAAPLGAAWPNPFAGRRAIMLPLRNRQDPQGEWINERRDLRADLRAYAGLEAEHIHAVAIMSDTDNAGGQAQACFSDIHFSAD